jgi:sugar lactone lactonase YvrE
MSATAGCAIRREAKKKFADSAEREGHMPNVKPLLDGLAFAEGPRWHNGKLWFSDMQGLKVMTVDLDGRAETIAEVPNWPSGLGWLPDGRLLIVSMTDRKLLRLDPDGLKVHADLFKLASFHCNDMVVDGKGNAYVGNFGYDIMAHATRKGAEVVLVTPEGAARVVASGLQCPNGSVVTADGKTLIVGESMGRKMTAFDIKPDGSLARQRVWAEVDEGVVPDGCALDAEGAIWLAAPMTNELLRLHEGGRISERVKFPRPVIACALGGVDRRTLFVISSDSIDFEECRAKRPSRIETMEVAVPGVGWP